MQSKIIIDAVDNDTQYAKLVLNPEVYTLQAIYAAGYVFLDKAYIILDKNKDIEVYLFPKNSHDPKKTGMEFYNELINYSHYFSRVESNSGALKTIMQRVLFTVNPKFAEDAEEQEIQTLLKELEAEELKPKDKHARASSKKKK